MSLSLETMGLFALWVLWVNTLLVAAAAVQQIRQLRAKRRRLAAAREVEIVRGDGPGGAFAEHRVEQVGRALDGAAPTVGLWDRGYAGRICGGLVRAGGEEISVPASEGAEVWIADPERQRAATIDPSAFDAVYAAAGRTRGFARTVVASLKAGDRAWLFDDGAQRVVSGLDPSGWLSKKIGLGLGFIGLEVAGAALATGLALTEPRFGPWSMAGAGFGLVWLLAVQLPGGVVLRKALRTPDQAPLLGTHSRPAAPPPAATELPC
jgi:hypothetical protein